MVEFKEHMKKKKLSNLFLNFLDYDKVYFWDF